MSPPGRAAALAPGGQGGRVSAHVGGDRQHREYPRSLDFLRYQADRGDLDARHVLGRDLDDLRRHHHDVVDAVAYVVTTFITGAPIARGAVETVICELERAGFVIREVARV